MQAFCSLTVSKKGRVFVGSEQGEIYRYLLPSDFSVVKDISKLLIRNVIIWKGGARTQ